MHQVALLTESCSKTKKLPEIWKVAEKLPSNLWKGLVSGGPRGGAHTDISPNPGPESRAGRF